MLTTPSPPPPRGEDGAVPREASTRKSSLAERLDVVASATSDARPLEGRDTEEPLDGQLRQSCAAALVCAFFEQPELLAALLLESGECEPRLCSSSDVGPSPKSAVTEAGGEGGDALDNFESAAEACVAFCSRETAQLKKHLAGVYAQLEALSFQLRQEQDRLAEGRRRRLRGEETSFQGVDGFQARGGRGSSAFEEGDGLLPQAVRLSAAPPLPGSLSAEAAGAASLFFPSRESPRTSSTGAVDAATETETQTQTAECFPGSAVLFGGGAEVDVYDRTCAEYLSKTDVLGLFIAADEREMLDMQRLRSERRRRLKERRRLFRTQTHHGAEATGSEDVPRPTACSEGALGEAFSEEEEETEFFAEDLYGGALFPGRDCRLLLAAAAAAAKEVGWKFGEDAEAGEADEGSAEEALDEEAAAECVSHRPLLLHSCCSSSQTPGALLPHRLGRGAAPDPSRPLPPLLQQELLKLRRREEAFRLARRRGEALLSVREEAENFSGEGEDDLDHKKTPATATVPSPPSNSRVKTAPPRGLPSQFFAIESADSPAASEARGTDSASGGPEVQEHSVVAESGDAEGVRFVREKNCWQARWLDAGGVLQAREFSVEKFGSDLAHSLAVECRKTQVAAAAVEGAVSSLTSAERLEASSAPSLPPIAKRSSPSLASGEENQQTALPELQASAGEALQEAGERKALRCEGRQVALCARAALKTRSCLTCAWRLADGEGKAAFVDVSETNSEKGGPPSSALLEPSSSEPAAKEDGGGHSIQVGLHEGKGVSPSGSAQDAVFAAPSAGEAACAPSAERRKEHDPLLPVAAASQLHSQQPEEADGAGAFLAHSKEADEGLDSREAAGGTSWTQGPEADADDGADSSSFAASVEHRPKRRISAGAPEALEESAETQQAKARRLPEDETTTSLQASLGEASAATAPSPVPAEAVSAAAPEEAAVGVAAASLRGPTRAAASSLPPQTLRKLRQSPPPQHSQHSQHSQPAPSRPRHSHRPPPPPPPPQQPPPPPHPQHLAAASVGAAALTPLGMGPPPHGANPEGVPLVPAASLAPAAVATSGGSSCCVQHDRMVQQMEALSRQLADTGRRRRSLYAVLVAPQQQPHASAVQLRELESARLEFESLSRQQQHLEAQLQLGQRQAHQHLLQHRAELSLLVQSQQEPPPPPPPLPSAKHALSAVDEIQEVLGGGGAPLHAARLVQPAHHGFLATPASLLHRQPLLQPPLGAPLDPHALLAQQALLSHPQMLGPRPIAEAFEARAVEEAEAVVRSGGLTGVGGACGLAPPQPTAVLQQTLLRQPLLLPQRHPRP